jgi:anti-anti-sigma regulatory factor
VNTEFDGRQPKVIFDADSLDENSSTITQLAIMTALKKEMDLMNGSLKICSLRPRIKDYLFKNRLNRIFDIYEDLNSAETSPWKRKGYEEKQWNRGTAA